MQASRRRKTSEYGLRLREKQKVRYYYGIREHQLGRYVQRAARMAGSTGNDLFRLLESRLDNIVFRLGLAPTIQAARQLIRHGHILVGARRVGARGFEVTPGDVVSVHERSRSHPAIVAAIAKGPELAVPSYLRRSEDGYGGEMLTQPSREDAPLDVRETLVVEFYSR